MSGGIARITLAGSLSAQRVNVLREQLDGALDSGAQTVVLETDDLVYLDPEAVRYLALAKQHRDFRLAVTGAHGQVADELADSELNEELVAVGDPR